MLLHLCIKFKLDAMPKMTSLLLDTIINSYVLRTLIDGVGNPKDWPITGIRDNLKTLSNMGSKSVTSIY